MSKENRRQITLYMNEDVLDRIDQCIAERPYKVNRTFFITMATLEYLKRMEKHGDTEVTEIPQ